METNHILLGWLAHLIVCFYLIRPLNSLLHRSILTLLPCFIFILVGCYNLPLYHMSSIMMVSLSWMLMFRLIQLIILTPNETQTFRGYLWKFFWLTMPIIPNHSKESLFFCLASAGVKLFITHWITRWLFTCQGSDSYARIIIFFAYVCAGSFLNDLQIFLVRLLTKDKYTVLEFNHYPFLAQSVREFWGRRYNLLVSTLLKESIFDPLRRTGMCSSSLAALMSFLMSGLLHGHVAMAGFGVSSPLPAFLFFLLQGIACFVEVNCPFTPPKPVKCLLTQGFLLITAPLYLGLFTRAGPKFYELNKPLLYDSPWIPKIPVPNFCP